MPYHIVESPTGLLHIAPNKRWTTCGREIDLERWMDRGQTPPLATRAVMARKLDSSLLCERCFKH